MFDTFTTEDFLFHGFIALSITWVLIALCAKKKKKDE